MAGEIKSRVVEWEGLAVRIEDQESSHKILGGNVKEKMN